MSRLPATPPASWRLRAAAGVVLAMLVAGCTSSTSEGSATDTTATESPAAATTAATPISSTGSSTPTATPAATVAPTATTNAADEAAAVPVATRDVLAASEACPFWDITDDGRYDTATVDGELVRRDLHSGEVTAVAAAPEPCMVWYGDQELDRILAIDPTSDPQRFQSGTFEGVFDSEWTLENPAAPLSKGLVASGRILMAGLDQPTAFLMDDATGEIIGDTIRGAGILSAAANADGSLFAVGLVGADTTPQVVVLDGQSGEVVATIEGNTRTSALVFDEQSGDLLAGLFNGFVATIDVASGEIVAEVDPGTTETVFDLAVEDDGTVVVLTTAEVVRMARRDGQIGEAVVLRDAVRGRLLEAGSAWWVETSDRTLEIYDAP